MTLNVSEASAVNRLLDLLLGDEGPPVEVAARAKEAAVLLAGSAHKRLMAGWTPDQVDVAWTWGGQRECRECGCTDEWGCDEGCSWVGEQDLCTACFEPGRDVVTVKVKAGIL